MAAYMYSSGRGNVQNLSKSYTNTSLRESRTFHYSYRFVSDFEAVPILKGLYAPGIGPCH